MNKKGKKLFGISAVIALIAVLGVCLVACNADTYKNKLEKAGYGVVVDAEAKTINGALIIAGGYKDKAEWSILASKGTDHVMVVKFEKSADAKKYYDSNLISASEVKYIAGAYVIYGSAAGVKAAK